MSFGHNMAQGVAVYMTVVILLAVGAGALLGFLAGWLL